MSTLSHSVCSVYGPVQSWRYGRSLGIDPIGKISTCSFDCVYCQLGEINWKSRDRHIFVPTINFLADLQQFAPWDVDVITLSGSGEPTLALNLAELISIAKNLTHKPVHVLTNGSLLTKPTVQQELAIADQVAVKLDAVSSDGFTRINRPLVELSLDQVWQGLLQFRQSYTGVLAIQTMLLSPWSIADQDRYIVQMQSLQPDEIQLNTPTRPRPLTHQLDARGNHTSDDRPYPTRPLKPVNRDYLQQFQARLYHTTGIRVRSALESAIAHR